MNKWTPDSSAHQSRRIGKTLEELGELTAVLARISIQGIDAIDPATGKTNRQRMLEETADVVAQITINQRFFNMLNPEFFIRVSKKVKDMQTYEEHF